VSDGSIEFRFTERAGVVRLMTSGLAGAAVLAIGRGRLPSVSLHGGGLIAPLVLLGAALLWLVLSRRHTWTLEDAGRRLRVEERTILGAMMRMVPLDGVLSVGVVRAEGGIGLGLRTGDEAEVVVRAPAGCEAALEAFAQRLRATLPRPEPEPSTT
jgi:hypothetical protein